MRVPRYRIGRDDRVVVDGRELRLAKSSRHGHVFDVVGQPGQQVSFARAQFAAAVRRKGFRRDPNYHAPGRAAARLAATSSQGTAADMRLSGVPKREHPGLLLRHEYVERFVALEAAGRATRSDEGMARAADVVHLELKAEYEAQRKRTTSGAARKEQVNAKASNDAADRGLPKPCAKTYLRWVLRYEQGGRSILALRYGHHRSGNRARRVSREMRELTIQIARGFMSDQRPTRATIHRDLKIAARRLDRERAERKLPSIGRPSRKALYDEIAALPKAAVHAARYGFGKAEEKYGPLGAGLDVTRAGQRVEMDEWEVHCLTLLERHGLLEKLDAEWRRTAERHRLVVCEAVCVGTGITLGLSFSNKENSSENALACLAMVFADKTPLARWAGATSRWDMRCSPEEIVTDGGSGFVSDEVQAAVLDLLGTKVTPPKKRPQLRACIERRFRTREQRLMPLVPGRTYSNPFDKGDYDAHERAAILDVVLRKLVIIDAVDVCANSPSTGRLRGATPLDTWDRLVESHGIFPEPDAEDRRNALGVRLTRTLGRHGVRVLCLEFSSNRLQRFFRTHGARPLEVRVDPSDLGHVSVWADGGWMACVCRRRGLAGVPADVWVAAEADLRRRHAERARLSEPVVLDAIERMRAMVGASEAQFGLGGHCPTPEMLEAWEARMDSILLLPEDDDEASPRDLKGAAVPRGTPISSDAAEDEEDTGESLEHAPSRPMARRRRLDRQGATDTDATRAATGASSDHADGDDAPRAPGDVDRAPSPNGIADDFTPMFEDLDDFDDHL